MMSNYFLSVSWYVVALPSAAWSVVIGVPCSDTRCCTLSLHDMFIISPTTSKATVLSMMTYQALHSYIHVCLVLTACLNRELFGIVYG